MTVLPPRPSVPSVHAAIPGEPAKPGDETGFPAAFVSDAGIPGTDRVLKASSQGRAPAGPHAAIVAVAAASNRFTDGSADTARPHYA